MYLENMWKIRNLVVYFLVNARMYIVVCLHVRVLHN